MIHDDKFGLPIVMVKMLYYIVSLLQKKQTNKQNKQTKKQPGGSNRKSKGDNAKEKEE